MLGKRQVLEGGSYQFGGVTVTRNQGRGFGIEWRVHHQGSRIKTCYDLKDAMDYGEQLAQRLK